MLDVHCSVHPTPFPRSGSAGIAACVGSQLALSGAANGVDPLFTTGRHLCIPNAVIPADVQTRRSALNESNAFCELRPTTIVWKRQGAARLQCGVRGVHT